MTGENTDKKHRKARTVAKWFFILLAGLVLLIFFGVPLFLSSAGGTGFLLSRINSSVDGLIQLDDFSFGWFRGIKLKNLSYADTDGNTSVQIRSFQTQPAYMSLLLGKVKLGKTVIEQPRIHMTVAPEQNTHSPKKQAKTSSAKSDTLLPVIPLNQIDLELTDGAAVVELVGDVPQTLSFSKIISKVQFDKAEKTGAVNVSTAVDESSLVTAKGDITLHKTGWMIHSGSFDIKVSKLKLESLKPLFALAGSEVDITGELNSTTTAHIGDDALDVNTDAVITDFTHGTGDQRVAFDQPLTLKANVSGVGQDFYIRSLNVQSQFCTIKCSGTPKSLNYAIDADLAQTQGVIGPFVDMGGASIAGTLSARGRVDMPEEQVHLISKDSKIQQLKLLVPDNEPFVQDEVTLNADVLIDMGGQTIDVHTLDLEGRTGESLIRITKGSVKKKVGKTRTHLSGHFDAEYDWQVLSAFASPYLPEGLSVQGKRKDAFSFASEYPTEASEEMFSNLAAEGAVGFGSADYFGLNFGPTELKMNIRKGILDFEIPQAIVNEGKLQFAGTIDLNEESKTLRLKEPMPILDNIHINDKMTNTLLKYLSPVFAGQSNISGFASLTCNKLEIPFDVADKEKVVVDGVVEMDKVRLKAVGLVGDILDQTNNRSELEARLLPSQILLQNGVMQYDEMEFHLDKYPTGFSGKIYLDKTLDMDTNVPYKFDVDRLRFQTVKIGEDLSDRLLVPIEGTVDKPKVPLDKLFDSMLKKHSPELIQKGIEELLKNL